MCFVVYDVVSMCIGTNEWSYNTLALPPRERTIIASGDL